ncbi:MAG: HEAT repeat domain-containing protein [Kofleriaceae bacterium]
MLVRVLAVASFIMLATPSAHGYAVTPALTLTELAGKVDLIAKATVIRVKPVKDPWFEPLTAYEVREAELRVVSTIKGTAGKTIKFRYYTYAPRGVGTGYAPQAYTLEPGRTYLVFATGAGGGVFRPFSKRHTQKEDQGVVLAADTRHHRGKTVTEAVRGELVALLASKSSDDVIAGITQLDEMSGGKLSSLRDFDRPATLAAIRPLLRAKSPEVASAAISVFAVDSPYLDDAQAGYWFTGFGHGSILGLQGRPIPSTSTADAVVPELLDAANRHPSPAVRALAIRALGRSPGVPDPSVLAWTRDSDLEIRRAGILISASRQDRAPIRIAVTDKLPEVRLAAALAIGFAQDATLLPLLGPLLGDPAPKTAAAAALAALSYPLTQSATLLEANLRTGWKPLFVNALSKQDPVPYLRDLELTIEKQLAPSAFWGGTIPAAESWRILFAYVKGQPAADVATGKLDRSLDALERMKWWSSSEPRSLYALYLVRKHHARAKKFRAAMKQTAGYDIDYYFNMADKDPGQYIAP